MILLAKFYFLPKFIFVFYVILSTVLRQPSVSFSSDYVSATNIFPFEHYVKFLNILALFNLLH